MNAPVGGGGTVAAHLAQVEKHLGHRLPEAHVTDSLPVEAEDVWLWFLELHVTRGHSSAHMAAQGVGTQSILVPSAITYVEIEAWARLRGVRLELWQLRLLRRIDAAYIESRSYG